MTYKQEVLPHGTRLYAGGVWPITTDSLLLAAFCRARRPWSCCDLGAGSGALLFSLLDEAPGLDAQAVEIDATACELLRKAAAENGFAQLRVANADLREYHCARPFDLVVANPPYYENGARPAGAQRAQARHQISCSLTDVCQAAHRLLKDGGRFCLCWPAGQLAELFAQLRQQHLAPKRLQLVRKNPISPPWLALVDARKNGGAHLDILPDIIGAGKKA